MPSPFPGMDPYIEAQVDWLDFHNSLIGRLRDTLGHKLPRNYIARTDERAELIDVELIDAEEKQSWRPDLTLRREERSASEHDSSDRSAVATIEPVAIPVRAQDFEEYRHSWVEIRKVPTRELVTVIEVLSPTNKRSAGRTEYLQKRRDLINAGVNLVEIDLLLSGRRLPMKKPLPPADYYLFVLRAHKLPMTDVYAWPMAHPLPPVPIPLQPPDEDVIVELRPLVDAVYDLGRYAMTIEYENPLPRSLAPADETRAWVATVTKPAPDLEGV